MRRKTRGGNKLAQGHTVALRLEPGLELSFSESPFGALHYVSLPAILIKLWMWLNLFGEPE